MLLLPVYAELILCCLRPLSLHCFLSSSQTFASSTEHLLVQAVNRGLKMLSSEGLFFIIKPCSHFTRVYDVKSSPEMFSLCTLLC